MTHLFAFLVLCQPLNSHGSKEGSVFRIQIVSLLDICQLGIQPNSQFSFKSDVTENLKTTKRLRKNVITTLF